MARPRRPRASHRRRATGRFGPRTGNANGPACTRSNLPPNVIMQACPNSQLFEAVRLVQNGQTVENQTSYPTCAMANLYTKYDMTGESAGSNALLTRRKDMRTPVDSAQADDLGLISTSELRNPKQTILQMCHENNKEGGSPFEIAEPLWLASTQGSSEYYRAANDYQLLGERDSQIDGHSIILKSYWGGR
eukprot:COSAG03_NODE_831_length_5685_cov_144.824740_2_plen_191_part_00